jgi:hypothetical protein
MKTTKIVIAVLIAICGLALLAMTAFSGPVLDIFASELSNLILSISFGLLLLAFGGLLLFK